MSVEVYGRNDLGHFVHDEFFRLVTIGMQIGEDFEGVGAAILLDEPAR